MGATNVFIIRTAEYSPSLLLQYCESTTVLLVQTKEYEEEKVSSV